MSNKKPKHCSIMVWVEGEDAEFAEVLRELCLEGPLRGSRTGTTLIFPEKSVRDDLKKKVRTSAGISEALTIMEGHILMGAARTAADFGTIGTLQHFLLPVEKSSGSNIILVGGTQLSPAESFIPLKANAPMVVWLAKGVVPPSGPPAPRPQFAGKRRGAGEPKFGGAPKPAVIPKMNLRTHFAKHVECEFGEMLKIPPENRDCDPYLNHSVSLLNYLNAMEPQLLGSLLPLVDREPATTFYLLVEPYKTQGTYLISDSVMAGWNNASYIYKNAVSEYEAFLDRQIISQDPADLRSAVDSIRMDLMGQGEKVLPRIPGKAYAAYQDLCQNNRIGNMSPVLPQSTLSLVGSAAKKVWQDEMRFILHGIFAQLREDPIYNSANLQEALSIFLSRPGDNYEKESFTVSLGPHNMSLNGLSHALLQFINSTDFLYFPVRKEYVGGAWGDIPEYTSMTPNPNSAEVLNIENCRFKQLESFTARGYDAIQPASQAHIAYAKLLQQQ